MIRAGSEALVLIGWEEGGGGRGADRCEEEEEEEGAGTCPSVSNNPTQSSVQVRPRC